MAVTKTIGAERIRQVVELGIRHLGENRVQEATEKRPALSDLENAGVTHHLIGALQTNKARKAVELFDVIQSVDRLKLAQMLDRIAGELGKIQRFLVEVKVSREPTKSGIPIDDVQYFLNEVSGLKNLKCEGLMTIGALDVDAETTRASFQAVAALFRENLSLFGSQPVLSMGMSDDYKIAIEEGSTMVRLGRALFGERSS